MKKSDVPSDPSLRWEWIKYQLRIRGTSLAKLAREQNVSDAAVKKAKRMPYPRMERAIANALDLHPLDLWPDRWKANGSPLRDRPNRAEHSAPRGEKNTAGQKAKHVRNRARAKG